MALAGIPVHPAGLLLAAAYAIACVSARQFSLDQFFLPAGIRVAALLIVPQRRWPYVLLGELGYFAYLRIPTIDEYGLEWVILASTLLMPMAMLVVHLHLRKTISEAATGFWLLSLSISAAVAVTGLNLSLSRLLWPVPPPDTLLDAAERVVFGHFAAIITMAPLALLWARRRSGSPWQKRLLVPSLVAIALMLALGLCMQLISTDAHSTRTHLVLLAALPAITLTFMHGWRGAAIAIPLLNLPLHFATPSTGLPASFDLGTFSTQQNMAVMSVALLALGSSISYHHQRARSRGLAEETTLRLTRSSHQTSERELRERAAHLKRLGDGMDSSLVEMVSWLKSQGHHAVANSLQHASSVHSRLFREQASMVYPTGLEQVGLYIALQAGGACEIWNNTHRVIPPRLAGNPCLLTVDLQLAIYRSLIEAVSLLLELETGQVCVRARSGQASGRRGIVAIVSLLDRGCTLSARTTDQAVERLAGRMLAYGGTVHCRGNRLRLVLHESITHTSPAAA
ncbi:MULTISPECIES: MASE1 domain-containing protein [unclassified Stenotrophomonas]|uniref:MASE1 domain-containing protein n=1 Tax=unclassified Stenotrophomonas TaxID=196198 RepID=UPI002447A7E7|nr:MULTISPECIES: MASE1 domain-containing protein [unclassified Stenotrophomonas]MBN5158446.1 MASE1 domain-containing protein [Stenotrophomonas maltophilia]MDG9842274.1 MASE1 domain-containing protein [Stenotrophomonas sp. GD04054]MDH0016995.1 MASE1 domain-containing protein [Stenotrophomonas sp. GD04028]MDH0574783.1 MASE1 domain-containing protein [Stenotrophomonas sp. GD03997]MDH0860906.1 MASE1 domain-containing protein [Stenotrophomonas sp. GD03882]